VGVLNSFLFLGSPKFASKKRKNISTENHRRNIRGGFDEKFGQ
jgi:hypothetical protein